MKLGSLSTQAGDIFRLSNESIEPMRLRDASGVKEFVWSGVKNKNGDFEVALQAAGGLITAFHAQNKR
jgi:hypothetical protein